MCDDGECFRYMANRRRSRKRRWCHACNETIAAGQHYVRIVAFGYGYADYTPQCDRCHAIFNAIAAMKPGEVIRFDLDCGSYIEDEDHPLQWLAFALPGDFDSTSSRRHGEQRLAELAATEGL